MRTSFFILFAGFIMLMTSCRNEFEFTPSTGGLEFSRDTVYLDTVFTNVGSSTYTLKVYNRSDKDISIPSIRLAKGTGSKYRMMVDGMTGSGGKIFQNVELLAKDSLFVFIETTAEIADTNPADFLYTDQILFGAESNLQKVELVTLIQDAVFLYPQRDDQGQTEYLTIGDEDIYGFYLDENDPINGNEYIFTNQRPYVIYGYAGVAPGKTLSIEPGARIHFHEASGILVANGASLKAIGGPSNTEALENEIIFEGDRLEPMFSNVPGQWGAIWLTSGSLGHEFKNVTIKNGVIGLYVQDTDVTISETQIYDFSNYGILAQTATITGKNIVINSAGQAALACTYGGSYNFTHSTFNNNWPSSRQVAVIVTDNVTVEANSAPLIKPLTAATFNNCIIYGSNQIEMLLDKQGPEATAFNYQFNNCLIKFNNTSNQYTNHERYLFDSDPVHYNGIIRNEDPKFQNISTNNLRIEKMTSSAYKKGNDLYLVPTDIINILRTSPPDLGAYEASEFGD